MGRAGRLSRKNHCILSIDPSWRGMAIVLYSPYYLFQYYHIQDITRNQKNFDSYKETNKGVHLALSTFFDLMPGSKYLIDTVIIEQQFKQNMQKIKHIVESQCYCFLGPDIDIHYVQSFRAKEYHSIEYKGLSHYQNKKQVLKYFKEYIPSDKYPIINSFNDITDDNAADAILQLSYYCSKLKKMPLGDLTLWSGNVCPLCGETLVLNECRKEGSKFLGKWIVSCRNYKEHGTELGKALESTYGKSFLALNDPFDTITIIKRQSGQKRKPLERTPSFSENRKPVVAPPKIPGIPEFTKHLLESNKRQKTLEEKVEKLVESIDKLCERFQCDLYCHEDPLTQKNTEFVFDIPSPPYSPQGDEE